MRVQIMNWGYEKRVTDVTDKLVGNGTTQDLSPEEFHALAKRFFDEGLNVMLYHGKDGTLALGLDTRAFQSR